MTTQQRALVVSFADCGVYHVAYTEDPLGHTRDLQMVKGKDNRPLKFTSLYRAKRWWLKRGETKAWLAMQSPYDEMIGTETAGISEIPLPLQDDEPPTSLLSGPDR